MMGVNSRQIGDWVSPILGVVTACVLIGAFAYALSFVPEPTLNTYRVELTRPDGNIQKTWYLKCQKAPIVSERWGGQTYIQHNGHWLDAPTGWYLNVEKHNEHNE
jgi:hypothetical protein